jgi:hypothetical protein
MHNIYNISQHNIEFCDKLILSMIYILIKLSEKNFLIYLTNLKFIKYLMFIVKIIIKYMKTLRNMLVKIWLRYIYKHNTESE